MAGAICRALPSRARRRRCAVLRFLADEGTAPTIPGLPCRGPARRRSLPKVLSHQEFDRLFAAINRPAKREFRPTQRTCRLSALIELLYGRGWRATELVSLPRNAIQSDRPYIILKGKGGTPASPRGA